jgi:predicted N-acetyltransferase YhbS
MVTIIPEKEIHVPQREALLDRAFGPKRRRKTSERLREGRIPADSLAFAAVNRSGRLIGTVRLWDIDAGTAGKALLLGPVAVDARHRGRGLGSALMRHAIAAAQVQGARAILLVGDQPFYSRFGFVKLDGLALPGPVDPDRFLGLELEPGALAGATGLVAAAGLPALDKPDLRFGT